MKTVIYNSKLAKMLLSDGYAAIMLFGFVFIKGESLTKRQIEHEKVHQGQFSDCVGVGLIAAIVTMFTLFACDIRSWWMFLLLLIPISLFYFLYGMEWLIRLIRSPHGAYRQISFEREAYDLQEEYRKPCAERRSRHSFSWFKYY